MKQNRVQRNLPATATKYKTNYKTKARPNIWQSKNALTTEQDIKKTSKPALQHGQHNSTLAKTRVIPFPLKSISFHFSHSMEHSQNQTQNLSQAKREQYH